MAGRVKIFFILDLWPSLWTLDIQLCGDICRTIECDLVFAFKFCKRTNWIHGYISDIFYIWRDIHSAALLLSVFEHRGNRKKIYLSGIYLIFYYITIYAWSSSQGYILHFWWISNTRRTWGPLLYNFYAFWVWGNISVYVASYYNYNGYPGLKASTV